MNKIRIVLIEDHPEYREVVELALGKEPDMDLIRPFGTVEMALRSLQDSQGRHSPDIVLLDLNLPGMGGLDAIPLLAATVPKAKIIILTQSNKEADVLRAITLGASGYLLKGSSRKQITDGIRTVMAGGATLDAGVARFVLTTLQGKLPKEQTGPQLSKRELDVLSLLAEGLAHKEIASRLDISNTTVVTHINHIYEKLNVPNAPAAINKAHRFGLFQSEPT
jgi:two-component system nitrate/nitrite response regulator NarL